MAKQEMSSAWVNNFFQRFLSKLNEINRKGIKEGARPRDCFKMQDLALNLHVLIVMCARQCSRWMLFASCVRMCVCYVRDPLIVLFQMLPLPHFWCKLITRGLKHFVSLIAFGISSKHRMCFWLPVYHGYEEKIPVEQVEMPTIVLR